jgi:hypothetical protein
VLASAGSAAAESVLFIGNSFTYGAGSAVRYYRSDTVHDLNDRGIGGLPALFESFTRQAGLDYEVSLETRGGTGLDFHLENKRDAIGSPRGHRSSRTATARSTPTSRATQRSSWTRQRRSRTCCARRTRRWSCS